MSTAGGPAWHRRCYIAFVARNGQAREGGFSNNKGGFRGRFVSAEVTCTETDFAATIRAVVDESRTVQVGEHLFRLKGTIVGGEIVSKVDTIYAGTVWKKGTDFMGSIRPQESDLKTETTQN